MICNVTKFYNYCKVHIQKYHFEYIAPVEDVFHLTLLLIMTKIFWEEKKEQWYQTLSLTAEKILII